MNKLNVLLVCGSGASSGFMAANMRKAAKKKGMDIKITASSESEIENYIEDIDALMVGPHLSYLFDETISTSENGVKKILMKPDYYATLNGDKAIDHLLENLD